MITRICLGDDLSSDSLVESVGEFVNESVAESLDTVSQMVDALNTSLTKTVELVVGEFRSESVDTVSEMVDAVSDMGNTDEFVISEELEELFSDVLLVVRMVVRSIATVGLTTMRLATKRFFFTVELVVGESVTKSVDSVSQTVDTLSEVVVTDKLVITEKLKEFFSDVLLVVGDVVRSIAAMGLATLRRATKGFFFTVELVASELVMKSVDSVSQTVKTLSEMALVVVNWVLKMISRMFTTLGRAS